MAERILVWDEFNHVFEAKRYQPRRIKPIRSYRNPLFLAREWEKMRRSGGCASQTALARKVGVSRARVSQMLRLLKLLLSIQQSVIKMGDPLTSRKITERKVRALLVSPRSE